MLATLIDLIYAGAAVARAFFPSVVEAVETAIQPFDDGNLALAVLALLAVTAIQVRDAWAEGAPTLAFLMSGVVPALAQNVLRVARPPSR